MRGAERKRLENTTDPRLQRRIHFYVDEGTGVRPESDVGSYAHEVRLNNIYDPATRIVPFQVDANAFESAVLNAGFDGYKSPFGNNQSVVVLLGPKHTAVPVAAMGQVAPGPRIEAAPAAPTTLKKSLLSRELKAINPSAIPGARVEMGNLEVPADQAQAANAELERIGSTVRFSKRQRTGRAEQVGDFQIRVQKDGTIGVSGDVNEIRSLLPDGVKGRPVPGGIVFTTSDAPRVRAALEGRKLAYSRAGQVLGKLPMKNGKYIGAPEKYNTPAKIPTLRKNLRKLTLEGERGRYWYENSSRAILMMAGGNVQEARKFVALLAIYSPQAKVDANSTFALRAWAQYKAGQKISVKTSVMDNKAQDALDDVDAFWSGEKTGNFFNNLLREIDPSTAGKQGATIDMWMMRAGEYNTDVPSTTQYAFMENETNQIALEMGWEPQQVQAAIWVAMKARMENPGVKRRTEQTSEKKGWIRFDYPLKNGKPLKTRVILNAKAHRDNWLKHAFAHTPTQADTEQAKFDFSDGVRRHIGQISWEARPGRSTNVLPGVNDASYEQQTEFQQAVQKALLDDNGVDLLAYKLGLLVDGPDILAPGVWQGEIAAGMQKFVAMAPAKGNDGKSGIDPAQSNALNTYAAMLGLLLRQEGVGYHRPFYSAKKSAENGVNLDIGRTFTPDEAQAFWGAIDARMQEQGVADWEKNAGLISSPSGMRVVNFGAIEDNKAFRQLVKDAAETLTVEDIRLISFTSDGDLIENNWKEKPNGEDYRSRISSAGSPDLLGWARDVLAPRIQAVFDEFSSRYGWGNPGQVDRLFGPEDSQQASAEEVNEPSFSRRLIEDIPNDEWLQGKIDYALKKGRNQWGVPHMSTVTGYFRGPVDVSLRVLSKLKGQRDEQNNVRKDSLDYIRENWDEVSQYPPYIEVAYNGEAWISEGNHRIMVAAEMGLDTLPVEIRYFDGGQRRNGPLAPQRILSTEDANEPSFSRRQPEFFSQLARSIDSVPDRLATQPAQQWKAWLASNAPKLGVKKDEIEWSGINDYLDLRGKDKVTKAEISDYLANNGVQVKDVTLFDPDTDFGLDDWLLNWAENNTGKTADLIQKGASWDDTLAQAKREGKNEVVNRIEAKSSPARYQRYTISGGENYREVLLTLPSKNSVAGISPVQAARILFNKEYSQLTEDQQQEVKRRINDDETPQAYMSSHWDKPNVLAHLRLNDRSDVDGNRVLFVEELQSDWGQEGKKKGFKGSKKFTVRPDSSGRAPMADTWEVVDQDGNIEDGFTTEQGANQWAENEQQNQGLPVAPFVTKTEGWLNLALKRVAMLAVEGGYDKVAFVNGEQSADRYDLSKQVDVLIYNADGKLIALSEDGRTLISEYVSVDKIEDYVGKEVARKLMEQPERKKQGGMMVRELSGIDLKVGGEGMKAFYDQIVPQTVNKLLPKIGGQRLGTVDIALPSNVSERDRGAFVIEQDLETPFEGEVTLRRRMPNGDTVTIGVMTRAEAEDYTDNPENYTGQTVQQPGFDVTDQMRETVSQGLPMFSRRQKDSWLVGRDEVGRINFGAGAKAYDAVAALANRVLDYVKLKPISPELSRAIKRMKNEIEKVQDLTARTAELLKDIPESERQMISDVIEGELKAGVTPPQHVLNLAASMQSIMSQQSAELVRLGMLSSAAAARWDNKYLPRFYESRLGDEAKAWARAAKSLFGRQATMQGIKGDSLKARGMFETIDVADLAQWQAQGWEQRDPDFDPAKDTQTVVWRDFSRAERERMGEIRDAMFRFTMGYMRTQRDIALGRLYESLSQNYASAKPLPGYVQVPNTKVEGTMASRYGKLSNMWVPPEVLDQLSNVDRPLENGVLKIYRSALSKWKEGKTVLNPVSHANNVISNVTQAHFAGVSYWDVQKYAGAIKDLVANSAMVKEANDIGLFGGTFVQSEIVQSMPPQLRQLAGMSESKLAKMTEGIWDTLAFTVQYNGKKYGLRPVMQWAYEHEDLFFRYLIYRDARKRGLAPEDAREFSEQYIFTYDDLPKGARVIRDAAIPFFTYSYKITPVLARTLLEYPWRYAAPAAVAYAANAAMYAIATSVAGGDDDEWWGKLLYRYATDAEFRKQARELEKEERQNLPPWMKGASILGTPKAIRMGMDDVTGLPMFLDISRVVPGGDIVEAENNAGGMGIPNMFAPNNPILTTLMALQGNRDMFTGKDVVNKDTDTSAEQAEKRAAWAWKQFSPAIAIGNYHFNRAMNVYANVTGKPITLELGENRAISWTGTGRDGLPTQPELAALQTFGIKLRPIDLDTSAQIAESNRKRILRDLETDLRRLQRLESKGAISEEAADADRERILIKRDRVRERLTVDGEEPK